MRVDERQIQTTEAWKAEHANHGAKEVEDAGHPDGWCRLICPCGGTHVYQDGEKTDGSV